jgi:hypothetical protein
MNSIHLQSASLVTIVSLCSAALRAAEPTIDFDRQIRPILSQHCFHCHGPDRKHREGGLRFDDLGSATSELESGETAVVPGKPEASALIARIFSTDKDEIMPPPKANRDLKESQKNLLRRWIAEGAKFEKHWAFRPPRRAELPKVIRADWPRNPLDHFVLARLERKKMSPAPDASKEMLLRRLSLDLTGLPPTLTEADAFLADQSPEAYEKLVDRLLASPRFGERLAVPWLDAARYADTNGFSTDDHRDMWLWREWIIDAINHNMPYSQFVVEQLAGDLLPGATDRQRLATGFLRNSMNTSEGGTLPQEYRVIYIADKIDTVSTVFMGLTLRCAQCHEHKYDPFSQQDYYRFYAFFDTAHEPGVGAINGNTAPTQRMDGLLTDAATFRRDVEQRIATLRRYQIHPPELIKARAAWEAEAIAGAKGELAAALKTPPDKRSEKHWATINAPLSKTTRLWGRHLSTINREIAVLERDLKAGKSSVMIMKEQGPRQTYVLTRGQYDQPDKKKPVTAGLPEVLSTSSKKNASKAPAKTPAKALSRLDLARWLTSPDHPLTARVAVNRYWQMLFGRGLVSTPNDFGSQGAFPTHPALLDWLALEYREKGWDTKRLIKTIVMSATYRQTSSVPRTAVVRDPLNELLARAPRYRLSAEFIRDGALAIAGSLDTRVGGPSVYPRQPHGLWREVSHFGYPEAFSAQAFYPSDSAGQNRRSMYTFWKRTSPPPSMIAFDAPTREVCAVGRSRTNTPLQALVLLNDPEYVDAARKLAALAISKEGSTAEERLGLIFRRATSRNPDATERKILLSRLNQSLRKYRHDTDAARALVGKPAPEHAAWTVVASIVLNLDEVITRE